LPPAGLVLCNNIMRWTFPDPLALASGAAARLVMAGLVAAMLWAAVAWAMAA
jgi:hypothetical protein